MSGKVTHPFGGGTYIPGDFWSECARCGFDKRQSELVKEPETELMVCTNCVDEPRDSGIPVKR